MTVVILGVLRDFGYKFFDAFESLSSDGALRDEVEPCLYLIEPEA